MKLFKWVGAKDIILLPFTRILFRDDVSYKIIWGDKTSGEWESANLPEVSLKLYKPMENVKLQPVSYKTLVEFIWSKKFSDFLKKTLK
jgi:hypothetical protein